MTHCPPACRRFQARLTLATGGLSRPPQRTPVQHHLQAQHCAPCPTAPQQSSKSLSGGRAERASACCIHESSQGEWCGRIGDARAGWFSCCQRAACASLQAICLDTWSPGRTHSIGAAPCGACTAAAAAAADTVIDEPYVSSERWPAPPLMQAGYWQHGFENSAASSSDAAHDSSAAAVTARARQPTAGMTFPATALRTTACLPASLTPLTCARACPCAGRSAEVTGDVTPAPRA